MAADADVQVVAFDSAASIVGHQSPQAFIVAHVDHDGAAKRNDIRIHCAGGPGQSRCAVVGNAIAGAADVRVLLVAVEGDGALINGMGPGQQGGLDELIFGFLWSFHGCRGCF